MRRPPPLWLHEPALQQLFASVAAQGGEMRAVGGCVRDHLMDRKSGDIDLACSLPPDAMLRLSTAQGWKAIPTGIAHGTVTLVLPQRVVEVTTLRRDVRTDGRHAEVAFTDRFDEDALRRDFTMNAVYMDALGGITDPVGGCDDIEARCLRFIGDAGARIREDALRILRFFRFLATHGQPPADEEAITAIGAQKALLNNLSGERIQQEMKRLLMAPDPSYAFARMSVLAMGESLCHCPWQLNFLPLLLQYEAQHRLPPNPWVRLLMITPMGQRIAMAQYVSQRWKLSRVDMQWLEFLTAPPTLTTSREVREALRYYRREWIVASVLMQAIERELPMASLLPIARSFEPPVFPVSARDLLARGMVEGRELGEYLRALERRWIESDYTLSKEKLLP